MGSRAFPAPWLLRAAIAAGLWLANPAFATDAGSCLSGFYEVSQAEIAAGVHLESNGRFRYGLEYGARDEVAAGRWEARNGVIYLKSDPFDPPAFALLEDAASPDSALRIDLDVPDGMSRQYFDAELTFADGSRDMRQFAEEGLSLETNPANPIASVQVHLPIYDVSSDLLPVAAGPSRRLRLRFSPNDLGAVAFADEPLAIEGGDLVLERHGRRLRFRPVEGGCGKPAHR